ncbi:hypothetical protein PTKIN_Ptkin08bG0198200 [Pterospermum kingtungense]
MSIDTESETETEREPPWKIPKQAMSTDTESYSAETETESESESGSESKSLKEPCLRDWLSLPRDVTASILSRLGAVQIIESAQKVCTQWRDICKDPSMWRCIDMWNYGYLHNMPYCPVKMCMHAIDRSRGGLVDINIHYFGTDELLAYITERTSNLRRLRLIWCWYVSDEGLSEAASKFPLLEELEIFSGNTGKDSMAVVGRCCPLLKTFKYNQLGFGLPSYQSDDEALAIAENMHGLRHLQLIGNWLTNQGLQAILDGCPDLESLDLRKCIRVNLQGDIGKRCAKQIKNLRRPHDAVHDYPFIADSDYDYHGYDYGFGYYDYDSLMTGESARLQQSSSDEIKVKEISYISINHLKSRDAEVVMEIGVGGSNAAQFKTNKWANC